MGFILFFLTLNLANAKICDSFFQSQLKFYFTDPRLQQSEKLELGEGLAGKVYLQFDAKTSQYVVIKEYKFSPQEPNSQFHNDLRAFEILRSRSQLSFSLPDVQKVEMGKLRLSYHPGRTIEDLFYDPKIPSKLKKEIEKRYIEVLREMIKSLEGIGFSPTVKRNELPRIAFQKGTTQIILKPDNFIVDPETLKFTLIDPT